jgi:hypothetical protein
MECAVGLEISTGVDRQPPSTAQLALQPPGGKRHLRERWPCAHLDGHRLGRLQRVRSPPDGHRPRWPESMRLADGFTLR